MRFFVLLLIATLLGSLTSFATETDVCKFLKPVSNAELAAIGANLPGSGGCVGNQCPTLTCRDIPTLPYATVSNGNFRGTLIQALGYSEDLTVIHNSDLSKTHIQNLLASDLSGCNFQGAMIDLMSGYTNMTGTDLRGTTIGQIHEIDSITWTGAIYDSTSKFPFDDTFATSKGMIKK